MKRTIRTLALAAPLATVAISLGATPAQALSEPFEPDGPVITAPDPQPEIDDKAPPPPVDPEPEPDGPEVLDDEITTPPPCPTHGPCGDEPDDKDEKDPGTKDPGKDIPTPTRIDAGTGSSGSAGSEGGMELTWLLAGGALVTASGAAFAARRRTRTEA